MSVGRTAAVISDPKQIGKGGIEASLYLCTNGSTYLAATRSSVKAILLDEMPLAKEYKKINSWAYEVTWRLLEHFKGSPDKYDFLDGAFIDVKALTVQTLKAIRVVRHLRSSAGSFESLLFSGQEKDPTFFEACDAYFGDKDLNVRSANAVSAPPGASGRTLHKLAERPYLFRLERLMEWERKRVTFVLVSGALLHLGEIVRTLRRSGRRVVYVENSFNLEKCLFCAKHGVELWIVPRPSAPAEAFSSTERFFEDGDVVYDNEDLTSVWRTVFRRALDSGRIRHSYDDKAVNRVISSPCVDRLILDEDFSTRRPFFVAARRHSKKCFVVSHGVPALYLEQAGDLHGRYESSVTFVHSEFEKSAYESIYTQPSKLLVTGLPRYDRYVTRAYPKTSRPGKTVLYCGSIFSDYDFTDPYTVMGCKEFLGDFTKRYLLDLLALVGLQKGVTLAIKPHYREESAWREFLAKHGSGASWVLYSHREDIHKLESQADVIVTPESSVICEGLMLKKPIIVLNYGPEALSTPEFESRGVLWHAKDRDGLREGLAKCMHDKVYQDALRGNIERSFGYFAGRFDAASTARVVDAICSEGR